MVLDSLPFAMENDATQLPCSLTAMYNSNISTEMATAIVQFQLTTPDDPDDLDPESADDPDDPDDL